MSEVDLHADKPVPVVYVTDLTFTHYDPADLFDLAFLIRSLDYDLLGVCLTEPAGNGERALFALGDAARNAPVVLAGADSLLSLLSDVAAPVTLVVVGGYATLVSVLDRDRATFRRNVARVFVVGGYANEYGEGATVADRWLPTDPRVEQRNPERFTAGGDPRLSHSERDAWGALLSSGEAIIWIPRDICLWRYAAPQVLEDGGALAELLRRELFYANLQFAGADDRYTAAAMPVLLSTLPAFLLAKRPDPFAWMRLFRVIAMRVAAENGRIVDLKTNSSEPNVFAVVAIDGVALGRLLTAQLRDRPLPGV